MLSLATFGVGFLMRPIGAIVLGAYIDRHGRREGLMLTLALMSFGTLASRACPDTSPSGLLAPLLVVVGRLFKAFLRALSSAAFRCIFRRSRPRPQGILR